MDEPLNFVPLLVVLFMAFLVPLLLARFQRVPVVVGEISAGMLIGSAGLRLVSGDEIILRLLSDIGFAFLMFLSGLEIDFSLLFRFADRHQRGMNPVWIGILSFLVAILLAAGVGWGFAWVGMVQDPWMMGLILSTTSLGIVVPVIKERGLGAGRFGQALLLSALVADFSTMFLITVYVAVRSSGITLDILLIGVLFLAVMLAYRLGAWQLRKPAIRQSLENLSGATSQVKVRGSITLMMAFVVLAEFLGVELILGAFLAGVVISLLSGPEDMTLRHKLDGIGFGFFIPLFFIVVGARFDLAAFLSNPSAWVLAPLLLAASFLIKYGSSLVFRVSFSSRETLAAGALLSARLSLIIAASAIGLRMGAISESTNAAIILVAALTATLAPFLFNSIFPEQAAQAPHRILIYGQSDIALQVSHLLRRRGEEVLILVGDRLHAEQFAGRGFKALQADLSEDGVQGLKDCQAKALIALSADDERNWAICQAATQAGIANVIAWVNEPARLREFQLMNVKVFTPGLYHPSILALLALSSDLFQLLMTGSDDQEVREFRLLNPSGNGIPVRSLGLPADLLILSIGRDGETIIPHGNTRLNLGDRITIFGNKDTLSQTVSWMEALE